MVDRIVLPPHIAASLAKVVREVRLDIALEKLIQDYLHLKLEILTIKISNFESKYGLTFEEFKQACSDHTLDKDPFSHEIEEDYREWESLITLREYYKELKV